MPKRTNEVAKSLVKKESRVPHFTATDLSKALKASPIVAALTEATVSKESSEWVSIRGGHARIPVAKPAVADWFANFFRGHPTNNGGYREEKQRMLAITKESGFAPIKLR